MPSSSSNTSCVGKITVILTVFLVWSSVFWCSQFFSSGERASVPVLPSLSAGVDGSPQLSLF
jgi:hypothetical protein